MSLAPEDGKKGAFQEFAVMKDSQLYEALQTGQAVYLSYVFEK